jgi:polysaccharide export outer membrane protein
MLNSDIHQLTERQAELWLRLLPRLILGFVLPLLLLSGANGLAAQETVDNPPTPSLGVNEAAYRLSAGDRIRVNVFNHDELSGEYQLDGEGRFSMPLIGVVEANDLNSAELEALLIEKFKPDFLVNPRIFIQLITYRPYYLIGEVASRGKFPYVAGMTYLVAIANAGGYTYRAKQDHVFVIRGDDPEQVEIKLSVEEKVQPGDIIRIAERFF